MRSDKLHCPECGNDGFHQNRSVSYEELFVVSFSLQGEIVDEEIEERECNGEDSSGAYQCSSCGWKVVDNNGDSITDSDEIVEKFKRAEKYAPTHIREAFQDFLDSDTETVEADGAEVGLCWFVDRLKDCSDILPAGYCSHLDLLQGSTYGVAIKKLLSEANRNTSAGFGSELNEAPTIEIANDEQLKGEEA